MQVVLNPVERNSHSPCQTVIFEEDNEEYEALDSKIQEAFNKENCLEVVEKGKSSQPLAKVGQGATRNVKQLAMGRTSLVPSKKLKEKSIPVTCRTITSNKKPKPAPKVKPKHDSFNKRMTTFLEQIRIHQKSIQAEVEYNKMKDCTFTPATNSSTRNLLGRVTSARSVTEFYHDQMAYLEKRNEKLTQSKVFLEQSQVAENQPPQICNKSRLLFQTLQRKANELSVSSNESAIASVNLSTAFDRLYNHSRNKERLQRLTGGVGNTGSSVYRSKSPTMKDVVFPFNPVIQEKSQNLKREASVGVVLYKDALKRRDKLEQKKEEQSSEIFQTANIPFTLKKSEDYRKLRFKELFANVWHEIVQKQGKFVVKSKEDLDEIMRTLHMSKGTAEDTQYVEVIWEMLSGGTKDGITKDSLYTLSSIILDLPQEKHETLYQSNQSGSQDCLQDSGATTYNKDAANKIHKFFWPLYVNYTTYKDPTAKLTPSESIFRPSIDKHSVLLAARLRPQTSMNLKHHELLLKKGEEYSEKRRNRELHQSLTEQQSFCFKPKINTSSRNTRPSTSLWKYTPRGMRCITPLSTQDGLNRPHTSLGFEMGKPAKRHDELFELSKILAQKKVDTANQEASAREKEDLQECTHKPMVNKRKNAKSEGTLKQAKAKENVREVKQFEKAVERMKTAQVERSRVKQMLEIRNANSVNDVQKKNPVPIQEKTLMVANVDLGKGRSDKLVLMEGMLIDEQIQAFAIKNNIKKAAMEKLKAIVTKQIGVKKQT